MDEFIGKVKEQASRAKNEAVNLGKRVYDRTNTAISIGKLSFAINETESKIKDEYAAIGKIVYDKYLEMGEPVCECVKAGCEAIDSLYAEKIALKEKKAELKESVTCPQCGEFNKKTAAYCSKCGSKLEEEAEEIEYELDVEEAEDDSNEDYTAYVDAADSKIEEVKEAVSEAAEKVKEAVEDAVPEEIKEKAEDVKDRIEEKIKKVIKIKAKKPDEE